MNYTARKIFLRKTSIFSLLVSLIPQIVCLLLRYFNTYSSLTYALYGEKTADIFDGAVSFIGTAASFAAYSVIVYLALVFGIRWGGEWIVAIVASYITCYAIAIFTKSLSATIVSALVLGLICVVFFNFRNRDFAGISLLVTAFTFLPYPAALAITLLIGTDAPDFAFQTVYGLMNFSLDMLILIISAQIGKNRKEKVSIGNESITVGGKITPKTPVLKANLMLCIVYTAIALLERGVTTVSNFIDYGMPLNKYEWFAELYPYIELAVFFVIGYLVMAFVTNKLEDLLFESIDLSEILNKKGKKHDLGRT